MPVIERYAVIPGYEDEALVGAHRLVDDLDGATGGRPSLHGRIDELAQRRSDPSDAIQGSIGTWTRFRQTGDVGVERRVVKQAAFVQPTDHVGGLCEVIEWLAMLELERVDEVECVIDLDDVGVGNRSWIHRDNHIIAIDRLRARGYYTSNH